MPILTEAAAFMSVPAYGIDQIIAVYSGSFTVGAASAGSFATATATNTTGFGDNCYFQGIYALDGGSTWNDFGVYQPNLVTAASPVFQTQTCRGYVTSGGVFTAVGINWYDNVHASSSSHTIQYKVALFSKIGQGIITPVATNELTAHTSKYNSQKVFDSGTFAISTSASTVVVHGLGYVPKFRAFFVPTNSTAGSEGAYTVPAGAMTTLDWFSTSLQLDTTQATFGTVVDSVSSPSGINGTMHWRGYLDA